MLDARTAYLETQIKTAAPQKLRLMLIEGAMRLAAQARAAHLSGAGEQCSAYLERARDIVTELIAGIHPEKTPLNETVRALYAFIFRSLAEAQLLHEVKKIDDALRVLQEERQTWLQLCETTPEAPAPDQAHDFRHQEVVASDCQPLAAISSFSLDA